MQTLIPALLLLAAFVFAAPPYRELPDVPFTHCADTSVISPGGRYYANNIGQGHFEIYDLLTNERVFSSRYYAWTPPYPATPRPSRVFFVFSPDDKRLVTDNYYFAPGKTEAVHWAEVWDLEKRRQEYQFDLSEFDASERRRHAYALQPVLNDYYSTSAFKSYHPNARAAFSPDGKTLWFLYPVLRLFSVPRYTEINGTFNMLGVDKDGLAETFHFLGAPYFISAEGHLILPIKSNTFIFNKFFEFPQDYLKVKGSASHIEVAADEKSGIFDSRIAPLNNPFSMRTLNGKGYFSKDGRVILCRDTLYEGRFPHAPQLRSFYMGSAPLIPSSSREFLFAEDRLQHRLLIFDFSSGQNLQSIKLSHTEYLLRDTDKGNRLVLRDRFSGKLRVLERN